MDDDAEVEAGPEFSVEQEHRAEAEAAAAVATLAVEPVRERAVYIAPEVVPTAPTVVCFLLYFSESVFCKIFLIFL